jgi:tetratricopeptide (TPR) repeat protein
LLEGGARPVVDATFAWDYMLFTGRPLGYHVTNLVIHWLASCTLFVIIRECVKISDAVGASIKDASAIALATACLWAVHPLQTNVTTNVVQRYESLMGLFYLATFAFFLVGVQSTQPTRFYLASVASCFMGMGCKEVMVTAPLLIVIFDRSFVVAKWSELLRKRWGFYTGLGFSLFWFAWLFKRASSGYLEGGIGVTLPVGTLAETPHSIPPVSSWHYLMTQAEVIPYYLLLCAAPINLCLDYGWPFVESLEKVWWKGLLICALVAASFVMLYRRSLVGFAGVAFFLILAPTSSIVPIVDAAFEHRLYLPLAAFLSLVVLAGCTATGAWEGRLPWTAQRVRVSLLVASLLALMLGTMLRNVEFDEPLYLYQQGITQNPHHARNYANAGVRLCDLQRPAEAVPYLEAAVKLAPTYAPYYRTLGRALADTDQFVAAVRALKNATTLDDGDYQAWNDLGVVLLRAGDPQQAEEALLNAAQIHPEAAIVYNNLGLASERNGAEGLPRAIAYYEKALELSPHLSDVRENLDRCQQRLAHSSKPESEQQQ